MEGKVICVIQFDGLRYDIREWSDSTFTAEGYQTKGFNSVSQSGNIIFKDETFSFTRIAQAVNTHYRQFDPKLDR